jgi:hypothetical protein
VTRTSGATPEREHRAFVERRRGWLCVAGGIALAVFARSLHGIAWMSSIVVEIALLTAALRAFRRAHDALGH